MWFKGWMEKIARREIDKYVRGWFGGVDRWKGLTEEVAKLSRDVQQALDMLKRQMQEIDHRVDRGNQIWRNIQAAEARRREKLEEEDQWDLELQEGDVGGGEGEELPAMPDDLEGIARSGASREEVVAALNRKIAGLE